jgi:pyruvate dehydrogenase E1 component
VRSARGRFGPSTPRTLLTPRAPIVTIHDAASHTMAWLGSALGVPALPLGVDAYGQSGGVRELYELHGLAPGAIVNAALAALAL